MKKFLFIVIFFWKLKIRLNIWEKKFIYVKKQKELKVMSSGQVCVLFINVAKIFRHDISTAFICIQYEMVSCECPNNLDSTLYVIKCMVSVMLYGV